VLMGLLVVLFEESVRIDNVKEREAHQLWNNDDGVERVLQMNYYCLILPFFD